MIYKISNVRETVAPLNVDPSTEEGRDYITDKLVLIFPDTSFQWGYDDATDTITIDVVYIPKELFDLGSVSVDGY